MSKQVEIRNRRRRIIAARLAGDTIAEIAAANGVKATTVYGDLKAAREGAVDFADIMPMLTATGGQILQRAMDDGDLRTALAALGRLNDLAHGGALALEVERLKADMERLKNGDFGNG